MVQYPEMKGKNYIVTGASSGIGRATCIRLSQMGANVILLARSRERLQETLEQMEEGAHTIIVSDIAAVNTISDTIDTIRESCGNISGFIHCAGVGGRNRLSACTPQYMNRLMAIHYFAFVEFVRCLVMKKKKKDPLKIVVMSSQAAISNQKYFTAYAGAKAAVEGVVRTMGSELILKHTNVNAVRAAYVATPLLGDDPEAQSTIQEEDLKKSGFQPMGFIAPEEVADLLVHLTSDAARSITGMIVPINAGAAC